MRTALYFLMPVILGVGMVLAAIYESMGIFLIAIGIFIGILCYLIATEHKDPFFDNFPYDNEHFI